MPLLSIIIPVYNLPDISTLLENIATQEFKDFELVVVDDASSKPCYPAVEAYQKRDLAITYLNNKKRSFTKNSRINGVEASKGDLITFIDADDTLYGDKALKYHVEKMQETGVDMLHFAAHISREGKASVRKDVLWGQPIAEGEISGNVFTHFVQAGCNGHTIWGKITRRQVWEKALPLAHASSVARYAEDFFLSSLLYFHTQSYYGSHRLGYVYDWVDKTDQKAFGRAATYHSMLEEFIPYIAKNGADVATLEKMSSYLIDRIRHYVMLFIRNNNKQYTGPPLPPEIFAEILQHGSAEKLLRVVLNGLV